MGSPTDYLEEQAELLFDNVAGWENRTLQYIGARIKKTGQLSFADVQQLNNIAVVNQDMEAITRDLASVTGYNISQLEEMYGNVIESQHNANKDLFDYRSEPFIPLAENMELQALVKAYSRTTAGTMINLSKTKALGFIDETGAFKNIRDTLYDALGKATMEVASGTADFNTAMRKTIEQIGGSGIRINYGGGVTRRLDTVVRANVLWGAKQASVKYNEMIGEQLDCDGIEIDWHSNPRPSHEFMQGKQYSLSGKKTVNGVTYESADAALEALEDYGCLHFKTTIILGVSEPAYSPEELERLNKKTKQPITVDGVTKTGYEWKQSMRKLETEARKSREQITLSKAAGNKDLERKYRKQLKAINTKYTEIADATNIKAQPEKMRVYGKTVGKLDDKNIVAKSKESGIIKIKGMYRTTSNAGAFSILPERMSKKHIRNVAKEVGIDLKGITINIDTNEELLRVPFAGRADPENVGGVTFFPNAFRSREELIRTIFHEKQHVLQYREHGIKYVQRNRKEFEDVTDVLENEFIMKLKEKGMFWFV